MIGTDIFDSDFTEEVGLELELPSFMKMIRGEGRDGFEADLELEKKSVTLFLFSRTDVFKLLYPDCYTIYLTFMSYIVSIIDH